MINSGGQEPSVQALQFIRSFYLVNVVGIQEKIYHYAYSISLSLPFSRQQENSWIRNLGTSFLCGGNDNVNSVRYHCFTQCKNVNVMRLFLQYTEKEA